ncbi:hypothetical protein [Pseudemcibacter aquimaris]|uniref:hypothetical protein n=1 Tax=Pseudemcibacter aquimaris TaxID=2857064 RepID=UPI0020114FF7|nr:hypothetical protein [Pseudemcibacter aquimaris]MCC3862653.1 hypothetical protein [Pseudemcibacter aquimaris]WDU57752.1 hypothetical protein KW060_11145 [Pseudemcibacter aquimaris]
MTIKNDQLYITGPFSAVNKHDTIRVNAVFLNGDDEKFDGEALSLGSFYTEWNDDIIYSDITEEDPDFKLDISSDQRISLESDDAFIPYEINNFLGTCLRGETKLMAIKFSGNYLGNIFGARPDDIIFVFYDPVEKNVKRESFNGYELNRMGCLDEARQDRQYSQKVLLEEKALISRYLDKTSTDPVEIFAKNKVNIRTLDKNPLIEFGAHFDKFNQYYNPATCTDKSEDDLAFFPECQKNNSNISLVYENDKIEIHRVKFIYNCDSSGFDFLKDKDSGEWTLLYSIPGGCSKYFLFAPKYQSQQSNELNITFCDACSHWGTWKRYTVNTKTYEIISARDE